LPVTEQHDEWHIVDVTGRRDKVVATHYPASSRFVYCSSQWTPDGRRLSAVRTETPIGTDRSIAAFVTISPTGADERVAFTFPHPYLAPHSMCEFSGQRR